MSNIFTALEEIVDKVEDEVLLTQQLPFAVDVAIKQEGARIDIPPCVDVKCVYVKRNRLYVQGVLYPYKLLALVDTKPST